MAKTAVETFKIELPCPNCGKKAKKSLAWLKSHDDWVCAGCGKTVTIEEKERSAIKKAIKTEEEFRNTIRKIGKRLR